MSAHVAGPGPGVSAGLGLGRTTPRHPRQSLRTHNSNAAFTPSQAVADTAPNGLSLLDKLAADASGVGAVLVDESIGASDDGESGGGNAFAPGGAAATLRRVKQSWLVFWLLGR